MIVTVSGLSGLTKAYRSVLSATGSLAISGASRCDDMRSALRLLRRRRRSCLEKPPDQIRIAVNHLLRADHHRDLGSGDIPDVEDHRASQGYRWNQTGNRWLWRDRSGARSSTRLRALEHLAHAQTTGDTNARDGRLNEEPATCEIHE